MAGMRRSAEDDRTLSDLELIRRCSEGESRAQELLYRRYFSFAMSVCIRYTRDQYEAMEIVNDSYMKVLDNIEEFDGSRSFRSWYGRIVVNSAIDNYRRNSKHVSHLQISDLESTEIEEPSISAELSANDILSLFSKLPDNYRVTFNLFEIEGYTHEEIGQMLQISTSTSRSNLSRAKKMLRDLYKRNFNSGISNEAL
ncbi:MAG: sigma-70 family RNA polymerase sigma factor [Bacteroidales bacterium]|jgi:RNA polymerase sigma-70 factor (ECF subfamily)|nr:sigma-70 family RNA polymerase sigma factor [Bacteroidales bacterium]OQB61034.1 MAG: ECF RNA polymerase sigma-E factor [Bacteroidetes bacterium ADurb.Bin145]HOU03072.1 sigma-70 family RNA polymerase sigma factor [Bacteroidales bacterium]